MFFPLVLACHTFVCYNIKYCKEVVRDCSNVCPTSRSVVLLENWETRPFLYWPGFDVAELEFIVSNLTSS